MKPMDVLEQVGLDLERAWLATGYSEDSFPDLAGEALDRAAIHKQIAPQDIVEWAVTTLHPPSQSEPLSRFGQPPITLFSGRLFYIGALFWLDGTTAVHDHRFSGAFQVLAGGSLHAPHVFEEERSLGSFKVGRLAVGKMEHLGPGDVRKILPGNRFIHSLFHLERPSVTVVVRTRSARLASQFTYFRPGLAIDTYSIDEWSAKLEQIAHLCTELGPSEAIAALSRIVEIADPRTCFLALRTGLRLADQAPLAPLIERATERFHAPFGPCFAELRRTVGIIGRRAQVRTPDLRFFLALLMNAPDRKTVLEGVTAYRPDAPPEATITRFIRDLTGTHAGSNTGKPLDRNPLGLPEIDDECLAALRSGLSGKDPARGSKGAAYLDRLANVNELSSLFR